MNKSNTGVSFSLCYHSSRAGVSGRPVLGQSEISLGQDHGNMLNRIKRPLPAPHLSLAGGPTSQKKRMKMSVEISTTRFVSARANPRPVLVRPQPRPTVAPTPSGLPKPQALQSNTLGALGISANTSSIPEKRTLFGSCRVSESLDQGSR